MTVYEKLKEGKKLTREEREIVTTEIRRLKVALSSGAVTGTKLVEAEIKNLEESMRRNATL